MPTISVKPAGPIEDALAPWRSGSTEPWTAVLVAALAGAIDAHTILETGTYYGLTTALLAQFRSDPSVTIWSIDNDDSPSLQKGLSLEEIRCGNIDATGSQANVEFVVADAIEWITQYDGPPFDFAFVDDCHNYHHVAKELDLLRPKMRPGGIICGHDVVGPHQLGAVFAARHGFLLDLPRLHKSGGLGIIQIPNP